jgi:hypothetical protein
MARPNDANRSGASGRQGDGAHGAPDVEYDLISLIYHNLEGVEASGRYVSDAVEAGEDELGQLFRDTQQSYLQQADRARQLLRTRIGGSR